MHVRHRQRTSGTIPQGGLTTSAAYLSSLGKSMPCCSARRSIRVFTATKSALLRIPAHTACSSLYSTSSILGAKTVSRCWKEALSCRSEYVIETINSRQRMKKMLATTPTTDRSLLGLCAPTASSHLPPPIARRIKTIATASSIEDKNRRSAMSTSFLFYALRPSAALR